MSEFLLTFLTCKITDKNIDENPLVISNENYTHQLFPRQPQRIFSPFNFL